MKHLPLLLAATAIPLFTPRTHADTFGSGINQFVIDFVGVSNAGNGRDLGAGGGVYSSPYGGVAYNYRIATFEISQNMITKATNLGLTNVTAGPWLGNQPAASLNWYEAAAFVNWLNTSQGHQPAYDLTYSDKWSISLWPASKQAGTGVGSGTNPYRHKDAFYFLPGDDEWYKAAYHKNDGVTANYWDFPTGSNDVPDGIDSAGDPDFQAVFYDQYSQGQPNAIDNVGSSPSAYGTYGQAGNIFELLESAYDGVNNSVSESRAARGGSWNQGELSFRSSQRYSGHNEAEVDIVGFRVASIGPETSDKIRISVSQFRLCWGTETNRTYQLQYSTKLIATNWINVGDPVAGTGGPYCTTDDVLIGLDKFYRLEIHELP